MAMLMASGTKTQRPTPGTKIDDWAADNQVINLNNGNATRLGNTMTTKNTKERSFNYKKAVFCIRPGATPEDTLISALLQEKGAQTATDLQRQLGSSASMGNFSQSGATSGQNTRIKQEPTSSVQGKKLSDRISRAQNNKSKGTNEKSKSCYFCGNRFSANHKQSCPARNVTCRNCSKKGHFAKCCNSKNVANVEAESDETVEENCNFITSDSESEFAVLSVAAEEPNCPIASVKKLEAVNAATGKLRSIQITLRCGKTFFKATVDTGSPASFVNKKTADYILKTVPSAKVFTVQESPIDTVYVDYNRKRIELMGTLILDVSSLAWHAKSAKFLISENRTRCLLVWICNPIWGREQRKLDQNGLWWVKSPNQT